MALALLASVTAGGLLLLAGVTAAGFPLLALGLIAAATIGTAAVKFPEYLIVFVALVLPSGSFHPALRIDSPIGQLNPFQITVVASGFFVFVLAPQRAISGLRTAPAILGTGLAVAGSLSAISVADGSAIYWVINAGLVLVLLGVLVGLRYEIQPSRLEGAVFVGASLLALSLIAERLLGEWIPWFGQDPPALLDAVFRPNGLVGNSLVSAAALAVALALRLTSEDRGRLRYTQSTLYLVGIAVSLSRSAIIASVVATVGFALGGRRRVGAPSIWARLSVVVIGLGISAGLVLFVQGDIVARLSGGESDAIRKENLVTAWELFLTRPLFGFGMGGYQSYSLENIYGVERSMAATADNTFATILVDLGIVGCVVIAAALAGIWAIRRTSGTLGSFAPLLTWAVAAAFFDAMYHESMILLLAVALLRATGGKPFAFRKHEDRLTLDAPDVEAELSSNYRVRHRW